MKVTGHQSVMSVYGKANLLDPVSSTSVNACYHMVGRSSEVSLSKFSNIKMQNVTDNNGSYDVARQGIDRTKTGKYQELFIYPEKECFLYNW